MTVASLPDRYEERLATLWPGRFARLALFTLEAHDLALSKLARNTPIDREDVARLARAVPLDPVLLRERYETELRPIAYSGDREQRVRPIVNAQSAGS